MGQVELGGRGRRLLILLRWLLLGLAKVSEMRGVKLSLRVGVLVRDVLLLAESLVGGVASCHHSTLGLH